VSTNGGLVSTSGGLASTTRTGASGGLVSTSGGLASTTRTGASGGLVSTSGGLASTTRTGASGGLVSIDGGENNFIHVAEPAYDVIPVGHFKQAIDPVTSVNVPDGQSKHTPLLLYEPGTHGSDCDAIKVDDNKKTIFLNI